MIDYDPIDYDPCEDCRAYGNDYYIDKDGDVMSACYDCPMWEHFEIRREE